MLMSPGEAGNGGGTTPPVDPDDDDASLTAGRRRLRTLFRPGTIILILIVVALLVWIARRDHGGRPDAAKARPPVPVSAGVVARTDVPIVLDALGAAQAWASASVRAQVSGRLLSVNVTEGTRVEKGQLLAVIDPAPFQAALMQAQGTLLRDKALLENARVNLTRDQQLLTKDSIARQEVETQTATVRQYEGIVLTDQGAVNAAKVNLGYTRIVSPFSGLVGLRNVDPGNLVSASDTTGIVTVNAITPIAVVFSIPQADFARVAVASDNFRKALHARAASQEAGIPLGEGDVRIVDNKIDPSTGTVQLKAQFANSGHKLWAGQLINVRLDLDTARDVLTVPAQAVNHGPDGAFVYLIRDKKAVQVPVKEVRSSVGLTIIEGDIKPGQQVVTDGQLGLKPGSQVQVKPAKGPAR